MILANRTDWDIFFRYPIKKEVRLMRVLLLGFGKVGGAFCELLRQLDDEFTLVGVATRTHGCLFNQEGLSHESISRFRRARTSTGGSGDLSQARTWHTMELIDSASFDVLVESTHSNLRTGEPAMTFLRAGLDKGAHVITSNKGPLLKAFDELNRVAARKGRAFLYESTVLAGTPLFSLVREGLPLGPIDGFEGALNGTTNYILDLMEKGSSFDEALRDAQRRGFTESDPLLDVEGWDSAAKGIVVARTLMGAGPVNLDELSFEGIRQVTSQMLEEGRRAGGRVRLISRILPGSEGPEIVVRPEILPVGHPLCSLAGVQCGAVILTRHLGEVTVMGPGTGPVHTAYGLVRDLLSIHRGTCGKGRK